jgi:PAS domain S-box-containing protein
MTICIVASDLTERENSMDLIQQLRKQQEALRVKNKELTKAEEETRDSESRFRALFEKSPDAVFLAIPDAAVIAANPAACAMFGWTEQELCRIGRGIFDTDDLRYSAGIEERQRAGFVKGWELTAFRKDGEKFPVEVDSALIPGEPLRSFVIIRDITDRKRAEEALRKNEQRLRLLMRDAFVSVDMAGRILDFNPAFQEMLGYTKEELRQVTCMEITPEKWHEPEAKILREQVLPFGYSRVYEKEYRRKNGTVFPVELRRYLIRDEKGESCEIWAMVRDITERKRTEDAMDDIEERLHLAAAAAEFGAYSYDVSSDRLSCSPELLAMYGLPPGASLKLNENFMPEASYPEDKASFLAHVKASTDPHGSGTLDAEYRILQPDGQIRWVHASGRTFFSDEGRPLRSTGIVQDITKRKLAEEALRQRNRYIETILEEAPIGFAVHTVDDGAARFVSARFEEIYGVPRGTIDSHYTFFDKVWPNDPVLREQIRSRVVADMMSGDASRMHWRTFVQTANGQIRYITAMNIPVLEQNLMVSTVRDVTDHVRAQEALRESEERFRGIFEGSIEGIYWSSLEGKILVVNPAMAEMLGYDSPETAIRSVMDMGQQVWSSPEERSRFARRLEEQGTIRGYECQFRRKDGTKIWVSLNGRSVLAPDGRTAYYEIFAADITERKQAEEALQKSRSLLEETERIGKVGGWEIDLDTMKLTWTTEVYAIHEVDSTYEPTVEKGIQFYATANRPVIERLVRRAIEQGEPFDTELEIITAKGNLRSVHAIGRADPEHRRVYGFFQDITTSKQNEREMSQLRLELTHLTRVLTLNEISGSLAHEINQPLGAILNNAEAARMLLLNQAQDKQQEIPEIVEDIIQDARRAGCRPQNPETREKRQCAVRALAHQYPDRRCPGVVAWHPGHEQRHAPAGAAAGYRDHPGRPCPFAAGPVEPRDQRPGRHERNAFEDTDGPFRDGRPANSHSQRQRFGARNRRG